MAGESPYGVALIDWLACACGGAGERAATAVRCSGDDLLTDVAFAATAGHVLDYDDTFSDGVAHVSAATAPAALVLAAHLGSSLGAALDAYAEGYEAMAAVAAASHPQLYDAGWHPTAVCGPIGAVLAASRLLDLPAPAREHALALAVLRAGGTRGAFGSDGKAIQVGLAAAAGVQAALVARAGATVDPRAIDGPIGFAAVVGARWPRPLAGAGGTPGAGVASGAAGPPGGVAPTGAAGTPGAGVAPGTRRAIERNWIKLYPSCLGTHAAIEAAALARDRGHVRDHDQIAVRVHPVARQAAHLDLVDDGLSAKFSIPYCVAHTLTHGPPGIRDFAALDRAARERSRLIGVVLDRSLPEFGAVLTVASEDAVSVGCPRGAPERPIGASELAVKISELAGDRLDGVLDDLDAPAAAVLSAAGLREASAAVVRLRSN